MKIKLTALMLVGFLTFLKSQIVNIPDVNFKAYLISNPQINTNNDNQIQVSEAAAFTGMIDAYNKGINDITGIEFFINLTTLQCGSNNISNLDISKNSNLRTLYCFSNLLATIDTSKNLKLTSLWCGGNRFTSLDVSRNPQLESLYCEDNKITDLNLSKNTALSSLSCGGNLFTTLDISNNINLTWLYCPRNPLLMNLNLKNGNNTKLRSIYIVDNPNLTCVQVDDINYANSQPSYLWNKDGTASYNTNCLLSTAEIEKPQIKIYPNPAKEVLNFSEEVSNVRVSDFSGKIVKHISSSEKSINISKLAKGTYIISVTTKTGKTINKKFTKE